VNKKYVCLFNTLLESEFEYKNARTVCVCPVLTYFSCLYSDVYDDVEIDLESHLRLFYLKNLEEEYAMAW
jgi:hypothetical protein